MSGDAYVALSLVPGIGRMRLEMLLQVFGSAEAALAAPYKRLRAVPGMTPAAATAVAEMSEETGRQVLEAMHKLGGLVLEPLDERFPDTLREIPQAPPLLFVMGRVELLATPCVAIVGSRDHTRYGAEVTSQLAGGLARAGLTVVSGMARGLDALAHGAALDAGGGTIGVLGNGLGVVYPAANRRLYEQVVEHGCLLTEHPPGERPNAGSFPRRNRLISGLSKANPPKA